MNTFNQAIKNLTKSTFESFLRFPIVIGLSLIVSVTGISLIYLNGIYLKMPLENILLVAGLGIPLQLSITIINEELHTVKKWLFHLIGLLLLVFVYYTLPNEDNILNSHKPYIFYTALSVVIHLFLSFVVLLS